MSHAGSVDIGKLANAMCAATIELLAKLLSSQRSGDRLRAMNMISAKIGGRVSRTVDDPAVVPLLLQGLQDSDLRVQRAAARGLRPWIADDPSLLERVLSSYATHAFDGLYTHAGLLDTTTGRVWVPRFAAAKGHAALLPDANPDRYFRFEFFAPHQAPSWISHRADDAHLILYLVPEWSYSGQQLVAEYDERRSKANEREQLRFAATVVDFYRDAALPYDVRVHHAYGGGGHDRAREQDVACISARGLDQPR
jgi:hypothetical protein